MLFGVLFHRKHDDDDEYYYDDQTSRFGQNLTNDDYEEYDETVQDLNHNHKKLWLLILGLITCIGLFFGLEYNKIDSAADKVLSAKKTETSKRVSAGKPITVLTLGTDVGALGRDPADAGNTDSMELITINPQKKQMMMISLPRDILVKAKTNDGPDYVKLNAVYRLGGPKAAMKQVDELLNIHVDYYALVNMGTLKKVVNTVHGVNVDNPFPFDYEGHHFPKGKQHLNGNDALKFSRMRYDDPNNDYGRQARQQQVLMSVVHQFKRSGSLKVVNSMLDAVSEGLRTNVARGDIANLYRNYKPAMDHVSTDHFQGQNAMIDGVSFQIASPQEINRISKTVHDQLGDSKHHDVTNHETKMYKSQPNFDGGLNQGFILPGGARYNTPGSGNGSDFVLGSHQQVHEEQQAKMLSDADLFGDAN